LFTGDAGTGKTQTAMNLARRLGVPFLQLVLHKTLDNSIVEGRLLPDPSGSGWAWHYSKFATALTQPSVILLNELSRSSLGNTTLFLPVLEEGLLHIETINEVIKVHPECIIIADQNIGSVYSGAQEQDPALLDRFNVKLEFDYDPAIERKIVGSDSLVELAESLRYLRKTEPSKHKTLVSTSLLGSERQLACTSSPSTSTSLKNSACPSATSTSKERA
jgi:MoxR-like ATPase